MTHKLNYYVIYIQKWFRTLIQDNIMSGIDKETDQVLISKRQGQIEAFKQGEYYQYWDVHCLCKDQFKEPDCKMRYSREANFQRKRFEWSNSISEWVSEHRQQQAISQPSPEDPFEPAPPMEDDDPFQGGFTIQSHKYI